MERIIDVYYDRHGYPFKDRELTARFPVVGSEFLGASQTTTIRFHYEQIGTDENVYTVESKRPDGITGSQLLSKNTTEHYAEMSLSGWYSECKGDLFLSLKVYRGGTTATYNETTQLWEVSGVPVIESTGAIKLAINYTPMGRYENYNDAISTYQDVLAALGDKLDTIKGIVGVSGLSQVDTTEYEEGQLFFDVDTKNIYKLESGEFVKINNKLEIVDVSGYEYEELFAMFGTQPFMSYFEETNNLAVYQFKQNGNDYALYVWTYKNGCLYMPYVDMSAIFSIDDFTNLEYEKAPVITISSEVGTLSDFELQQVQQPNATIKFNEDYYTKYFESNNILGFSHIIFGENGSAGTTWVVLYEIDISLSNGSYRISTPQVLTYTKNKIDQLLATKQDKLYSGTNIKTINGESLLGSGNIVIQGGGGSAEWGSIGGDIADQTDLQNELQDIREVAEGKTRSVVISYLAIAPTEQTFSQRPYYDFSGNRIETWNDFVAFVNGRTFANNKFNSQNDDIEIDHDEYIIFDYHERQTVYRGDEAYETDTVYSYFEQGDIIIVKETTDQQGETIPDRWVYISDQTLVCSKLETSKVNLDNYSTKTETSTEVNKVAHDIAVEYDENTLYGSGDLCIKDKLLYKCNTDNTTGTWDSTKWDLTTVNSELGIIKGSYVDLTTDQTIEGVKTITNIKSQYIRSAFHNETYIRFGTNDMWVHPNGGDLILNNFTVARNIIPKTDDYSDIGSSSKRVKDLYLSGGINPNTNGYKLTLPDTTSWTADKEIATTDNNGIIKFFDAPASGSPDGLLEALADGYQCYINGNSSNSNALFKYGAMLFPTGGGTETWGLGYYFTRPDHSTLTLCQYRNAGVSGYNWLSLKNIDNINDVSIGQYYKKPQSSVSLSDGGTIIDSTLKGLIQNEQPIKLNGFTCYFSCDDGTNYQYVSTRYDATANKNHINVITIDKTTWVATFHTSDIAV